MRAALIFLATSLLCNDVSSATGVATEQKYCPTPDLASLEKWSYNIRDAAQDANLPSISSGGGDGEECPTNSLRQKVLFIGIDGLRTDAIAMLPLPNFRRLERMGAYSYWAEVQSTATAMSGPGWSSLMTGVQPTKHFVDGNGDLRDISPKYPNFLKLVKDTFPSKTVAASVKWHPLINNIIDYQDPTTLDGSHRASSDADMATVAENWIKNGDYDLIFTDFDACDAAGHSSGFDGYAAPYIDAVTSTDAWVGKLLDAILSRSGGEEWLIIVTSDHGGFGTSHGPNNKMNRRVPLIVASNSPRVDIGRAPHDDAGSQMDVLPTIMHFFGGPAAIPAGLDGQVFGFRDYNRTKAPPPESCSNLNPNVCGCADVKQSDYRGSIAVTATGRACQRWDEQSPQRHNRTPENYPNSGLENNYCRNPDGEPGAWCYTTDSDKRWELCDVPTCGDMGPGDCATSNPSVCGCADVKQSDYRGSIAVTATGRACQRWDEQSPQEHDRTPENYPNSGLENNYCRNPDGEPGAWCYTTDSDKRWELCDVPICS